MGAGFRTHAMLLCAPLGQLFQNRNMSKHLARPLVTWQMQYVLLLQLRGPRHLQFSLVVYSLVVVLLSENLNVRKPFSQCLQIIYPFLSGWVCGWVVMTGTSDVSHTWYIPASTICLSLCRHDLRGYLVRLRSNGGDGKGNQISLSASLALPELRQSGAGFNQVGLTKAN